MRLALESLGPCMPIGIELGELVLQRITRAHKATTVMDVRGADRSRDEAINRTEGACVARLPPSLVLLMWGIMPRRAAHFAERACGLVTCIQTVQLMDR